MQEQSASGLFGTGLIGKSFALDRYNDTGRTQLIILAAALILAAVSGAVQPKISILVGKLMNSLSHFAAGTLRDDDLRASTDPLLLGLAFLGTIACLVKWPFFCAWTVYGELQARAIREELFSSLVVRDFEWFEAQSSGVGSLLGRTQIQIREFQLSVSQPLGLTIMTIFQTIFSLGVAFYYSWRLTLVLLAIFSLIVLTLSLLGRGLQPAIQDQQVEMANAAKQASHIMANITIVKCYNGVHKERRVYEQILQAVSRHYRRQVRIAAKQIAFMRMAGGAIVVIALYYGANLIHTTDAKTGEILSTFWCCGTALKGFNDILSQALILGKGRVSAVALKDLIHRVREGKKLEQQSVSKTPQTVRGDIAFQDVSFAYPSAPDRNILNHLSMHFAAHKTTFVVGKSGSGKSTIGQLLLKLYHPIEGRITIDGMSLEKLDTNWLRNNVTVVQQDSVLFNDTLSKNITLGHRCPDQLRGQEILDSADFAMLGTTIANLPQGINTMVGQGGSNLSGGQRQRVALARARVRDTPILILDESTNALDHSTKISMMKNVREWRKDRTTVIITHDMSQIEPSDFTYVLGNGVVTGRGNYSENAANLERPFELDMTESSRLETQKSEWRSFDFEPRSSFSSRRNMSASSVQSDFGQSTRGDEVALLRAVSTKTPLGRDRGKAFRALLKSKNHSFRRDIHEDLTKKDRSRALETHSRGHEISSIMKSQAIHKRFTIMQAARPYSVYPALSGMPIPKGDEPFIIPPPKQIVISQPKEDVVDQDAKSTSEQTEGTTLEESFSLRRILLTVWPSLQSAERYRLLFALLTAVLYGGVPSISSWITLHLFQTFYLPYGWAEESRKWSLILTAITLGEAAAAFSIHLLFETLAQLWINTLRLEALVAISNQPQSWFDDERRMTAELCTTLDRAAEEMRHILSRFVPFTLIVIIMVLISIIWCFTSCWKLTLLGLGCAPVLYFVSKVFQTTSTVWESHTTDVVKGISDVFAEGFCDVRTVRALTLESYFHKVYMTATLRAFIVGLKRGVFVGAWFGLSESMTPFVIAGIFKYAVTLARTQEFTTQNILVVLSLLIFTMIGVGGILAFIPQISSGIESGARLLQLVSFSSEARKQNDLTRLEKREFTGLIELCDLTFSYASRPDTEILSHIDLYLPAGKCTVIVGSSGSGKSTILSLIMGLYIASGSKSKASLKISGHDINKLDIESLRSHIAYVPQLPVLFPATIRENILYGLDSESTRFDDDHLYASAKAAGVHEFIVSLPTTYDTVVGDGGLNVSGGQAQRIVVARALARQPKIILMDEPTSALDAESAGMIRNTIRTYQDRTDAERPTIVIVTHSRDMMRLADGIVVLEAGRIVEQGTYQGLIRERGKLWHLLGGGEESARD